jgi:hypothetical protein
MPKPAIHFTVIITFRVMWFKVVLFSGKKWGGEGSGFKVQGSGVGGLVVGIRDFGLWTEKNITLVFMVKKTNNVNDIVY